MSFLAINRRKFIRLAVTTGVAALAADGAWIEPNNPRVVRQQIALRRWPPQLAGFTIALLSDFHYDEYFSVHPLRAAIAMVNNLHPDLIALTGDFVSVPTFGDPASEAHNADPCAELLKNLHAPYGTWAVLGNHDVFSDPKRVTSALRTEGINVLVNRSIPFEKDGARFWLSGVDDVLGMGANLDAALSKVPANEPVVLMAHEPDYADYVSRYPVDLQLSGHSHGGQINLPLMRPLYLPPLGEKYVWGPYKIGGLILYTSRGIGTVLLPVRINCPPEITLLTLRPEIGR